MTSPDLLAELRRVLAYPKLAKVVAPAAQLADLVAGISEVVEPRRVLAIVSDERANRVLETALDGGAHFIVSGDPGLLNLRSLEGKPIVPVSSVDRNILGSVDGMLEWIDRIFSAYERTGHSDDRVFMHLPTIRVAVC